VLESRTTFHDTSVNGTTMRSKLVPKLINLHLLHALNRLFTKFYCSFCERITKMLHSSSMSTVVYCCKFFICL